jgi:hypothetical protein
MALKMESIIFAEGWGQRDGRDGVRSCNHASEDGVKHSANYCLNARPDPIPLARSFVPYRMWRIDIT